MKYSIISICPFIICILCISSSTPTMRTFSKPGEIYLKPCEYQSGDALFPLNKHPLSWSSCHDAYTFTWLADIHQELSVLTALDHMKLAYSTGYCPQNRCQLGNVTIDDLHSHENCPRGLCYTKVEHGSFSFGACCYTEGAFGSGNLIGYYNKSRIIPKPIYAHSRVILQSQYSCYGTSKNLPICNAKHLSNPEQEVMASTKQPSSPSQLNNSYVSFINANFIYPGIIATQCPISTGCLPSTSKTAAYRQLAQVDTTQDVLQMIIENNVKLWIQLSPDFISDIPADSQSGSKSNEESFEDFYVREVMHKQCGVLPFDYIFSPLTQCLVVSSDRTDTDSDCTVADSNLRFDVRNLLLQDFDPTTQSLSHLYNSEGSHAGGYLNMTYTVVENHHQNVDSCVHNDTLHEQLSQQHTVKHIWYYNWKDFQQPHDINDASVNKLVQETAAAVLRGETVIISCKSGRGRSGTFAAMVVARLENSTRLSELVDIVVRLRENRDGLVELPSHFRYLARITNISANTQYCSLLCRLITSVKNIRNSILHYQYTSFVTAFFFGVVACLSIVLVMIIFVHGYQMVCKVMPDDDCGRGDRSNSDVVSVNSSSTNSKSPQSTTLLTDEQYRIGNRVHLHGDRLSNIPAAVETNRRAEGTNYMMLSPDYYHRIPAAEES